MHVYKSLHFSQILDSWCSSCIFLWIFTDFISHASHVCLLLKSCHHSHYLWHMGEWCKNIISSTNLHRLMFRTFWILIIITRMPFNITGFWEKGQQLQIRNQFVHIDCQLWNGKRWNKHTELDNVCTHAWFQRPILSKFIYGSLPKEFNQDFPINSTTHWFSWTLLNVYSDLCHHNIKQFDNDNARFSLNPITHHLEILNNSIRPLLNLFFLSEIRLVMVIFLSAHTQLIHLITHKQTCLAPQLVWMSVGYVHFLSVSCDLKNFLKLGTIDVILFCI